MIVPRIPTLSGNLRLGLQGQPSRGARTSPPHGSELARGQGTLSAGWKIDKRAVALGARPERLGPGAMFLLLTQCFETLWPNGPSQLGMADMMADNKGNPIDPVVDSFIMVRGLVVEAAQTWSWKRVDAELPWLAIGWPGDAAWWVPSLLKIGRLAT